MVTTRSSRSKLKIAIYHNLPTGGAKRALYEQARRLSKRHIVDIYTLTSKNEKFLSLKQIGRQFYSYDAAYQASRIESTSIISKLAFFRALKRFVKLQRKVADQINDGGYDVVFVNNCWVTQAPAILQFLKIPSVLFAQEPRRIDYEPTLRPSNRSVRGFFRWNKNRQLKSIDVASINCATLVLANSEFSVNNLNSAYGVFAQLCYLGIEVADFQPPKTRTKNYILLVGAIEPFKNQLAAVDAVSVLPVNQRRLRIVYDRYDKQYRQAVIQRAKEKNVDLILSEGVSDSELVQAYQRASVTLCLAQSEPFGFTPLESAATGTPVVAIKEGGYQETVQPKIGILIPNREPRVIAQAIEKTKNISTSAKQMHAYVRQYWGWEKSVNRLEDFLTQAIIHG